MENPTSEETHETIVEATTEAPVEAEAIIALEPVAAAEADPRLEGVPEELLEIDDDEDGEEETGSGFVSGGFALASVGLGLVALSGSWFATAYTSYKSYQFQLQHITTQATGPQQIANIVDGWRQSAVFGAIFSLAALLCGVGVLAAPSLLLSGKTPGWARGAALGGVILALVGLLLAILTYTHVLPGNLTYPASAGAAAGQ
jgi:hypothetical protein